MAYDKELTKKILGDVGPLRFNPKVIKICDNCGKHNIVNYKGKGKPTGPYYCRSCVVNRPEVKQKISENTSKQWENEEFAQSIKENSTNIWKNEDLRLRMSKIHHDANNIEKTIERNKTTLKKMWSDENYRNNIITQNTKSTENVVSKLNSIHGDKFDYTNTIYRDSHTKIDVVCKKCGKINSVLIHNHIKNGSCSYCQISNGHRELIDYISGFNIDIIVNDRKIIHPLELDIYIPNKNIAIEYHGVYRHSYDHVPTTHEKLRHQRKALICRSSGIKLLQFFSYELERYPKIVKSMISHNLLLSNKIYARNCEIVEANADFFSNTHLQGKRHASVIIGLEYNGNIVSTMSFSKHHKYGWEIIRYSTINNTIIVGGGSKLFNAFIKKYQPSSIMTYSDLRYSYGNIYHKLGFNEVSITKPNYSYVYKDNIYSRQYFQKHKLSKRLEIFNPSDSEIKNCLNNGLRIMYDAGHIKWIWNK